MWQCTDTGAHAGVHSASRVFREFRVILAPTGKWIGTRLIPTSTMCSRTICEMGCSPHVGELGSLWNSLCIRRRSSVFSSRRSARHPVSSLSSSTVCNRTTFPVRTHSTSFGKRCFLLLQNGNPFGEKYVACPNNSIETIDQEYPSPAHIGVTQALLPARHPLPSADLSPLPPPSTPNALARDTLEIIRSRVSGPVSLFVKREGRQKGARTASW